MSKCKEAAFMRMSGAAVCSNLPMLVCFVLITKIWGVGKDKEEKCNVRFRRTTLEVDPEPGALARTVASPSLIPSASGKVLVLPCRLGSGPTEPRLLPIRRFR